MRTLLATALLCTSAAVFAEPVYLECNVSNGSNAVTWNVTMDEKSGSVAYSIPELGAANKYNGIFTRDSVSFDTAQISRIDLTFKRSVMIAGSIKNESGLCKIVNRPPTRF